MEGFERPFEICGETFAGFGRLFEEFASTFAGFHKTFEGRAPAFASCGEALELCAEPFEGFGKPRTEIQHLPFFVFGMQNPSPHGEEWRLQTIESWKKKFADLLFPALMKDNPRPFEELLEAMAHRRKITVPLDEYIRRQEKERHGRPTKKEMGRRFRLALLSLTPDELLNIKTVKAALEKDEKRFQEFYLNFDFSYYADDSAIYAAMKELNLRFLQPGDRARWTCGGKVVRMLEILPDGTAKESGMTLKEVVKSAQAAAVLVLVY